MNESFSREEAERFLIEIRDTLFSLFEGAEDLFGIEACGAYRRGEQDLKELDFLITRNDRGSCRHLLVKLLEKLEEKGLVVQQLKDIRFGASGAAGFHGIARLTDPESKCRRIDLHVYLED